MNLNAIVSKRLQLAEQNIKYADFQTVLSNVVGQNRHLSAEEIADEIEKVKALYIKSKATIDGFQVSKTDFLIDKIKAMSLTKTETIIWTSHVAKELLALNSSEIVQSGGFIPQEILMELNLIVLAQENNTELNITDERLLELLVYCLNIFTLISLANPEMLSEENIYPMDVEESSERISLSAKAVDLLRTDGQLSDYWTGIPVDKIGDLLAFVGNDTTIRQSNEAILNSLTIYLAQEYAKIRDHQDQPAYHIAEKDLEARHLLSIAILRNLQAAKMLPKELAEMNEEDLALAAYSSTELRFYFDEAAAGHITFSTFLSIAGNLLMALFFAALSIIYFSYGASALTVIGGIILAVFSISSAVEAVDLFLQNMFPVGIRETRIGVAVQATVSQIHDFAGKLLSWPLAEDPSIENCVQDTEVNKDAADDQQLDYDEDEDQEKNEDEDEYLKEGV